MDTSGLIGKRIEFTDRAGKKDERKLVGIIVGGYSAWGGGYLLVLVGPCLWDLRIDDRVYKARITDTPKAGDAKA